jgi:hypothetical protein
MSKKCLAAAFVSALLASVMAGTQLVSVGKANPWAVWFVPPDDTKPPVISTFSPANNTVLNEDHAYLSFEVNVGELGAALDSVLVFVRYETDWQHNNIEHFLPRNSPSSFSHKVNLTGIPEGNHSIAFQAIEKVTLENGRSFNINSSETILFTICTSPETKIPEVPSWIVLPLTMAATLIAVGIRRRKL